MHTVKFHPSLAKAIADREKRTTWRFGFDKPLRPDVKFNLAADLTVLDGVYKSPEYEDEFATAVTEWVKETSVGSLTDEDMKYHKNYYSTHEAAQALNRHYDTKISMSTIITVIRFSVETINDENVEAIERIVRRHGIKRPG